MPISYVLAAVQALSGAPGASGEPLTLRRYYPMQEAAGSTSVSEVGTGQPPGQWVGSPVLRGVYGPAENDSSSYGVSFHTSGGEYADLGSAADVLAAINGRGLFVCIAVRHVSAANRDTLLSASDASGAGFRIAIGQDQSGQYAVGRDGALFGPDLSNAANTVGASAAIPDLIYDNQWHLHMWFLRSPGTVKHWIDGVPKPVTTTGNAPAGAIQTGPSRLIVGATATGPNVDASLAQSYTGSMAHLMLLEGEPTQKQLRDLCRAMYYTVRGIPGVIAHYRPSADTCFTDPTMQAHSVEGGPIRLMADLSGHANHAAYNHPTDVPTLERSINGGRWCACFDNYASVYTQWGDQTRQQSLAMLGTPDCALVQTHMGCLATVRTQASAAFAKSIQQVVGFKTADGLEYNTFGVMNDEPALLRGEAFTYAQDIPKARCLPGLGILGFSSGLLGNAAPEDALFVNNRWQSPAAASLASGPYTRPITNWTLGGPIGVRYPGGGYTMWAGWMEEVIITKCPYLPDEAAAYVERTFREAGESLVPRNHVCVVGDSIASGNRSDRCRTMLGAALPIQARANTSFANASIAGYRVISRIYEGASLTGRGLSSPKWWDPASRNIAAVQAIVNDAHEGDDQPTFTGDIDALLPELRDGGATVVLWNEETNNGAGPGDTPRNLAIRSRIGPGEITKSIILSPLPPGGYVDGLHPTPPSQLTWARDWWNQGLAPYLAPATPVGTPAASRESPER